MVSAVPNIKINYLRIRPYGKPFAPDDTNSVIHELLVLIVLQY